ASDIQAPIGQSGMPTTMKLTGTQSETWFYQFSCSVVEHNLTDESNVALNLLNRNHFNALDPVIAAEIEKYITEMNESPSALELSENGDKPFRGEGSALPSVPKEAQK